MTLPLGLSIAWLAAAAAAAGVPEPAPERPLTPMTRDELRVCMRTQDQLDARSQRVNGALIRENEEAAAISVENARILRAQGALDYRDRAAVDAHNDSVAALDRRIRAHLERASSARSAAADLQIEQAAYIRSCASRPHLVDDRQAILAERRAAETAGSTPAASAPAAAARPAAPAPAPAPASAPGS